MPVSRSFVDFALDLLASAAPVQARRMFGGYGIYARGTIFGLLDDDELFLKVDEECRQAFLDAGCRQWVYPGPRGPVPGNYFRPPDQAHEEAEAMLPWAELALGAAARAAAARVARARKKAARAAGKGPRRAGPRAKRGRK